MTLIIVRPTGENKQKVEKLAEYHEGVFRGAEFVYEDFDWLEGSEEEEVAREFDGPPYFAVEHEPDSDDRIHQLGWFPDPDWEPESPEYEDGGGGGGDGDDDTEKAAEKAADAALTALKSEWGDSGNASAEASYPEVDDALFQMQERLVWWSGEDLSKAPPVWDSDDDVPQMVIDLIHSVVDGSVVWNDFAGYSQQAAEAVQNSLEENLAQPQGWSIESLVRDLRDMYSGMAVEQALNIARTETAAILNSAREDAYKEREDADEYVYYWQGPTDHRTTAVCREIKQEVERRGGNVPLPELRNILRAKAQKYENTAEGGTPERVDEFVPHYQCRHTFIRDVKAGL